MIRRAGPCTIRQFTVGPRHALTFLTMRGSATIRKAAAIAGVKDRPGRTALRQGYMLVAIADKRPQTGALCRA